MTKIHTCIQKLIKSDATEPFDVSELDIDRLTDFVTGSKVYRFQIAATESIARMGKFHDHVQRWTPHPTLSYLHSAISPWSGSTSVLRKTAAKSWLKELGQPANYVCSK